MESIENEEIDLNNLEKVPNQYIYKQSLDLILNGSLIFNFLFWVPIINFICLFCIYGIEPIINHNCYDNQKECILLIFSLIFLIESAILYFLFLIYFCCKRNKFSIFKNTIRPYEMNSYIKNFKKKDIKLYFYAKSYTTVNIGMASAPNPYGTGSVLLPMNQSQLFNFCEGILNLNETKDYSLIKKPNSNRHNIIKINMEIYFGDESTKKNVNKFICYCKDLCCENPFSKFIIDDYDYPFINTGKLDYIWNSYTYYIFAFLQLAWLYTFIFYITAEHITWDIKKIIYLDERILDHSFASVKSRKTPMGTFNY